MIAAALPYSSEEPNHPEDPFERSSAPQKGDSRNVVCCPVCSQRIRWIGLASGRATCPKCTTVFVVLVEPRAFYRAVALSEDAIDEMICDWIDEGQLDEDELDDDDRLE